MRILILGQPPTADWTLPRSADVVVCGPALKSTDCYKAVMVPDLTNLEQILFALSHADEITFDAVYCDYELAVVNAALVAIVVGARRAISPELALRGRDKLKQKQLLARAGVRTAAVQLVPSAIELRERFQPEWPYPVIIKPALGSGARDVRRVNTTPELQHAMAAIIDREPTICEEFINGIEYHIDTVMTGGSLVLLSVGRYLVNLIGVDTTHWRGSVILPFAGHEALYEAAERLVLKSLSVFGLTHGPAHFEVFYTKGKMIYSECGFRPGGGWIPDAITVATGHNFRMLCCLASIKLLATPGPILRPRQATAGILVNVPPGHVKEMPTHQEFSSVKGLARLSLRRDLVGTHVGYANGGAIIVTAPDPDSARTEVLHAADIFRERAVIIQQ